MTTSLSAPKPSATVAPAPIYSQGNPKRRTSLPKRIFRFLVAIAVLYVLAVAAEGLLLRLPSDLAGTPAPGERIGVLHIHTAASDGSGTVPQIMAAASGDQLSFMAITDHNVAMRPESLENATPDFAILSGEELSTDSGHFLTLGIPPGWVRPPSRKADVDLAGARAAGGFTVIAHPFHSSIPWTHWNTSDFDGMEIVNEDEIWRRDHWIDLLNAVILYGVNDRLAMVRVARRPDADFAKWDALQAERPVVGTCGTDAHDAVHLGHGRMLRFPAYTTVFRVAREHVLLGPSAGNGDPSHASAGEILDALRHGHAFCAMDVLYPAGGFMSRVSSGAATGGPGDFVTWADSGNIHVDLPRGSSRPLIKVFHDGQEMVEKQDWSLDAPITGPGRYRTEVYLRQPGIFGWGRWALWIFSNPTYVTSTAGNAAAANTR